VKMLEPATDKEAETLKEELARLLEERKKK